jgi:hypothetical protein
MPAALVERSVLPIMSSDLYRLFNMMPVLALKFSFHELSFCLVCLYIFIIFPETSDCVIDHTHGQVAEPTPAEQQQEAEEVCSIQAHRVIVAARCDWFRRALLSGMREAIDRYPITMHLDLYPNLCNNYIPGNHFIKQYAYIKYCVLKNNIFWDVVPCGPCEN